MKQNNQNRGFGLLFFIVFLALSLWPLTKKGEINLYLISIASIFLVLGLLNSKILTPLNKIWFKFGLLLGRIVSPVIIGFIFFLVVTPTALIMRLVGKDLLNLKFNKYKSYWIEKTGPKSKMKNQF